MYWTVVAGAWLMWAVWLYTGYLLVAVWFFAWYAGILGFALVGFALVALVALALLLWTAVLIVMLRWLCLEGRRREARKVNKVETRPPAQ